MNTLPYQSTIEKQNLFKNQLIPQRNAWVFEQVNLAFKRAGQYKVDTDILELVATDMVEELIEKYSFYSMSEIEEILKLGAKGELGDSMAISSRTVSTWLRVYKKDYRPKLAKVSKPEPLLLPAGQSKRKLTPKDLEEYIAEMYSQYHEDGTLYCQTYDLFFKYGVMELKDETIKRLIAKAKIRVAQDLDQGVAVGTVDVREFLKRKETDVERRVDDEAKRLAVGWYFDKKKLSNGLVN